MGTSKKPTRAVGPLGDSRWLGLCLGIALSSACSDSREPVDLILTGGHVAVVDDSFYVAETVSSTMAGCSLLVGTNSPTST